MTLEITLISIVCATILGFFVALMRLSNSKILRTISFLYVWIFRGTPLLLILFFVYYAPPFGIQLSAFIAGIIAMSINSASFKSEIIRAGILSVDKGQLEAAEAIGMSPMKRMFRILLPQAIRLIIPPYINNAVILLKESAQVSIITVPDLMLQAQKAYNSTYSPMETLGVAGVLYLAMSSLLMLLQFFCEKKLRISPKR